MLNYTRAILVIFVLFHLILSIIGHQEREKGNSNNYSGYSKYSNLALAATYTSYFIFLLFNTLKEKIDSNIVMYTLLSFLFGHLFVTCLTILNNVDSYPYKDSRLDDVEDYVIKSNSSLLGIATLMGIIAYRTNKTDQLGNPIQFGTKLKSVISHSIDVITGERENFVTKNKWTIATLLGSLGALVSFGYYYKYYREANEFEKERLAQSTDYTDQLLREKEAELYKLYQASKEYENQTEEAVKKYAKRDAKNSIERKKKLLERYRINSTGLFTVVAALVSSMVLYFFTKLDAVSSGLPDATRPTKLFLKRLKNIALVVGSLAILGFSLVSGFDLLNTEGASKLFKGLGYTGIVSAIMFAGSAVLQQFGILQKSLFHYLFNFIKTTLNVVIDMIMEIPKQNSTILTVGLIQAFIVILYFSHEKIIDFFKYLVDATPIIRGEAIGVNEITTIL